MWLSQSFDVQYISDIKDKMKLNSLNIAFINKCETNQIKDNQQNQDIGRTFVKSSAFVTNNNHQQVQGQNQIQVLSLNDLQTSRMNVQKAYENLSELYDIKQNKFYVEFNDVSKLNESIVSSKDPDYYYFSHSINANKNYIEGILS